MLTVLVATLTRPTKAKAQDPLTFGAVVGAAGAIYGVLKGAYDIYEKSQSWKDPVVTSSILNAAITEIQNTVIGIDVKNVLQQV